MPKIIQFSEIEYAENDHSTFADCMKAIQPGSLTWINLDSTNGDDFDNFIKEFEIHQLLVEDIKNNNQLPKFESFDTLSFMSIQMIYRHQITKAVVREHLSIVIRDNVVITIQEDAAGDSFNSLRQKIQNNYKRMIKHGIDYLFLMFFDAIIDEYMASVDSFRQPIEDLEIAMVKRPNVTVMPYIMEYKSQLNNIRRYTAPLREELQRIRLENPDFVKKQNQVLFRDLQDHINTLIINFENFREMLRDLADLHNSNQNLTLNNTMKTLTSISAVFIPLTFVVGVYGMNFKYFPELEWRYGYLFIWLAMLMITGGLVWYMKKKKWF